MTPIQNEDKTNIAVIGAGGNVGRRITAEALRRGHRVTALGRHPISVAGRTDLRYAEVDADDVAGLANALRGHDVVVSALPFLTSDANGLIDAVHRSGVKRYLVVGGAGSLKDASGKLHIESPHFPQAAYDESMRGKIFLDVLRSSANDLDWTMLSPSSIFVAGERTGTFRLGGDTLLVGSDGKSSISFEDFSIALLDEIENPAHIRSRFTVGY